MLEQCYDVVDYISLHAYYDPEETGRRELPRELGRHAGLHRERHRDLRPRTGEGAQRQAARPVLRRVERLVPLRLPTSPIGALGGASAAARGRLHARGRGRGRQPPHHAAPERGPREDRLPRAARERDRADHDGAGRVGLAADDLPPVRRRVRGRARRRRAPCRARRVADRDGALRERARFRGDCDLARRRDGTS